ncbi:hypothetical protein [Portibacter lacus]|uniref:Peptidase M60 domain-containing protein n=1 Tax=Portibacter lacus TaxID=1099794 RepID=A0AA37WIB3_9BACT|nr:hypothetical protein [Portibacter lacus]GLR19560.1 hypothetical protein GCM10007940_41760 [Portibacter lacus]
MQYQSRGFARNIDIVALYGWEGLRKINGFYYEKVKRDSTFDPYDIDDDEFIRTASEKLGYDLAQLFEFWGILPSNDLLRELHPMPIDPAIKKKEE